MIGGWRPWQRWMVARRLARHARREGGEPPADLLRRLREDIPSSPALVRHPDRPPLAAGERRGTSRRWLAAASLAFWDQQVDGYTGSGVHPGAVARSVAAAAAERFGGDVSFVADGGDVASGALATGAKDIASGTDYQDAS